jgi:hypothetical protein
VVVLFLGSESEISDPVLSCGFSGHLILRLVFVVEKKRKERE